MTWNKNVPKAPWLMQATSKRARTKRQVSKDNLVSSKENNKQDNLLDNSRKVKIHLNKGNNPGRDRVRKPNWHSRKDSNQGNSPDSNKAKDNNPANNKEVNREASSKEATNPEAKHLSRWPKTELNKRAAKVETSKGSPTKVASKAVNKPQPVVEAEAAIDCKT